MLEPEIQGDEATQRRAAEGGRLATGPGAVGGVNLRLELLDEEAAIAGGFAAAKLCVAGGGVLRHATKAGVGDADEDDRLDFIRFGETVGGGVGTPGVAGNIGGEVVEEVLAVVKIEDGKAAGGIGEVGFGEIDGDGALVGVRENGGVEAMAFQAGNAGDARDDLGRRCACRLRGFFAEVLWKQKACILRPIAVWLDETSGERFGFRWLWQCWVGALIYARIALG